MGEAKYIEAAIYRDSSWYFTKPLVKKMDLIPHRNQKTLFLVDDNFETALDQNDRVLVVEAYKFQKDNVLFKLIELIEQGLDSDDLLSSIMKGVKVQSGLANIHESHY